MELFIARKRQPKTKVPDNGNNFMGAANEFKAAFRELTEEAITNQLAEKFIKRSFNPPATPHFDGVWERLVRSCKKVKYIVLKGQPMKEDSFRTTLCIVEQLIDKQSSNNSSELRRGKPRSINPESFHRGTPERNLIQKQIQIKSMTILKIL